MGFVAVPGFTDEIPAEWLLYLLAGITNVREFNRRQSSNMKKVAGIT